MADPANSPSIPPPTLRKSTSSSQSAKTQTSIAGFFKKQSTALQNSTRNTLPINSKLESTIKQKKIAPPSQDLTPAPSSDGLDPADNAENRMPDDLHLDVVNPLPSPITPAEMASSIKQQTTYITQTFSSPSRKVCQALLLSCYFNMSLHFPLLVLWLNNAR